MTSSGNFAHDTTHLFSFNPELSSLDCDHWHHYYHYQASAQYLWLAETLCALGHHGEALAAYGKAIFQDHLNAQAIEGKAIRGEGRGAREPLYDKHPLTDLAFCKSIGKEAGKATRLHDAGIEALLAGDNAKAISYFDKAIASDPEHSNSYFARGKCRFAKQEYENARGDFEEALRLSHLSHEAYHRFASGKHLARALKFIGENELDLAVTCCTKALDLDRNNTEARRARASAYRAKGNLKLAEEDERSFMG